MTVSELEHFRNILLEREQNLQELVSTNGFPHQEDNAKVEALLGEIKDAFGRIENHTYGTCKVCQESVELYRLEVQPVAEVCTGCISKEERDRLDDELYLASKIHRALLPQVIAKIEGFQVAVKALAARWVGGDYYDFLPTPDRSKVRVIIADTMGKGIPAALLMSNVQGALRILSEEIAGPKQLITRINQWLCRNIPVTNFITLTCLAVEPNSDGSSRLSYTNAGHFPPILVRGDGKVERLEPNGGVLGVHEGFDYGEASLALNSGDLLLLYTDGVTESRNPQGELFGDEKLVEFVRQHKSEPTSSLLDTLLQEVQQFSGKLELDDDLTVIALRKL